MITVYVSILIILFAYFLSRSISKKQKISQMGICSICNNTFEDEFVIEDSGISFCKRHFEIYKESSWKLEISITCSPENEKDGIALYERQRDDFRRGTLGYLKPSYKYEDGIVKTVIDYYIID